MEGFRQSNAERCVGISSDSGLYSRNPVDRDAGKRLWKARLQKQMAEYQWLNDQKLFSGELSRIIPDEVQWDFIMLLAGYKVELPSRFQMDPLLFKNLKLLYQEIDAFNKESDGKNKS